MKISTDLTDHAILHELGQRLSAIRIDRNLTQAALADQAGVSKRTVERLESGEVAIQLSSFVRICRVLDVLKRFEMLVPEQAPSPMAQLKLQGRKRQRATGKEVAPAPSKQWTWGEPS